MAAVDDIYEVKQVSFARDQVGINVMHYKVTVIAGGGPTDQDLADSFMALGHTYWPVLMSNGAEYLGAIVRKILPALGTAASKADPAGTGSAPFELLPRQSSGIITWKTAIAGRRGRGRTYIPFPSESSNQADGVPTAGYTADLTTLAANALTRIVTVGAASATLRLVIFHRSDATTDLVTSGVARPKWATQKRRGSYGKLNQRPVL